MSAACFSEKDHSYAIVAYLLHRGASVNGGIIHDDSKIPIKVAVRQGNLKIVKLLLDHKAPLPYGHTILNPYEHTTLNLGDCTLLQLAVYKNLTKMTKMLVREYDQDVNYVNEYGKRNLIAIAINGHLRRNYGDWLGSELQDPTQHCVKLVKFLIKSGVSVNECKNVHNSPIVMATKFTASSNILKFLLKFGADPTLRVGNEPDEPGLFTSKIWSRSNFAVGIEPNEPGIFTTPLENALKCGFFKSVKLLLKHGVSLSTFPGGGKVGSQGLQRCSCITRCMGMWVCVQTMTGSSISQIQAYNVSNGEYFAHPPSKHPFEKLIIGFEKDKDELLHRIFDSDSISGRNSTLIFEIP